MQNCPQCHQKCFKKKIVLTLKQKDFFFWGNKNTRTRNCDKEITQELMKTIAKL